MTDAPPDDPRRRDLYIVAQIHLDRHGLHGYDLACGIDPWGERIIFLCCRPLLGLAPVLPALHIEHEQSGRWRRDCPPNEGNP
jgi:hypothetical protein